MFMRLRFEVRKLLDRILPFREDPELESLVQEIALLRRRAVGFDPEVGKLKPEQEAAMIEQVHDLIRPRLNDLRKYLGRYIRDRHNRNWYAEPTPDWCRWFAAGEVETLHSNEEYGKWARAHYAAHTRSE